MKKLAKKLKKVDIELPKWTRKILFDHLMEICENLKEHNKFMKVYPPNS
jgi:mRNA-degrading endonuclease RelE of RelBE toxin-antitoxin system